MNIDWQQPYWLILLIPVMAAILFFAKGGQFASPFRKKVHTIMRAVLCFVLILAMANPTLLMTANTTTTVFAVDRSASVEKTEGEVQTFLQEAQQAKENRDQLGLVSFGKRAGVELTPDKDTNVTAGFLSLVDKGGSSLENALRLSASLLPDGTAKRIVLLSDGNETEGNALQQARALAAQGITVDVYPLVSEEQPEVQLTKLELAEVININSRYELALQIDANIDTTAQVRLYKGNTLIADESAEIHKGETRMVFSDITTTGGGVTYRAEIVPAQDTMAENNRVYAYTYIEDIPRVLIVEQEDSGREWESMLSGQVAVQKVTAGSAPTAMEQLGAYDGVILANVSAENLPDGFLTALETYVRTTGGGLLVSGGENAFALGGYQNTPLEKMLPVDMDLKTEGQNSDLTMIMVIDRSGSMMDGNYGVSRIDMAKEAAIRSLDHFQQGDRVGVVAFDSFPEWVMEPCNVTENKDALTNAIGSIQADGGTSILPALKMAVDAMKEENTKQKHILLLTDGQAEQSGYDSLLTEMRQRNITLSTVAVGGSADTQLLQRLANNGNGRYYFTDEFTDLPEIFAKETILAGKEFINNRTFYPEQQDASAILSGIDAVTELDGYISTTAKARADKVLISDKEEPILATWQYGLGRTVAWTPDVHGQWTEKWLASDSGVKILRNAVSWMMKNNAMTDMTLTAEAGEEDSVLRLTMPFSEEVSQVQVTVVSSDNETETIQMQSTAPGIYEGVFSSAKEGAYLTAVQVAEKDGTTTNANTGFYLSYPKEYDMTTRENGSQLLQQIAESTGGRVLTSGSEVFAADAAQSVKHQSMQNPLLILGVFLLLLDIFLRRFPMALQKAEGALAVRKNRKQEKQVKKAEKPVKSTGKQAEKEQAPKEKEQKTPSAEKPADTAIEHKNTTQRLLDAKKRRGK